MCERERQNSVNHRTAIEARLEAVATSSATVGAPRGERRDAKLNTPIGDARAHTLNAPLPDMTSYMKSIPARYPPSVPSTPRGKGKGANVTAAKSIANGVPSTPSAHDAAAVVTPPRAHRISAHLKRKRETIEVNPSFDIYAEIKKFTAARSQTPA